MWAPPSEHYSIRFGSFQILRLWLGNWLQDAQNNQLWEVWFVCKCVKIPHVWLMEEWTNERTNSMLKTFWHRAGSTLVQVMAPWGYWVNIVQNHNPLSMAVALKKHHIYLCMHPWNILFMWTFLTLTQSFPVIFPCSQYYYLPCRPQTLKIVGTQHVWKSQLYKRTLHYNNIQTAVINIRILKKAKNTKCQSDKGAHLARTKCPSFCRWHFQM